jgi:hypothetical protein
MTINPAPPYRRLTGRTEPPTLETATAAIAGVPEADPGRILDALLLLRWVRGELAAVEPRLIAAARRAGVSWQDLAPALGVTSRQAAERRYLRLVPAGADTDGTTRDGRVRAERDRRAGRRAVAQWANDNTAGLRRLAGQITALTDLGEAAADDLGRLHAALADPDAAALPGLLADAQRHLADHPELADQIGEVAEAADEIRRRTQQNRGTG